MLNPLYSGEILSVATVTTPDDQMINPLYNGVLFSVATDTTPFDQMLNPLYNGVLQCSHRHQGIR